MDRDQFNWLSSQILDSAITVHKTMGPGLLESIYQECMMRELILREIQVQALVMVPLTYKGIRLSKDFVIDLLIEGEIIVELKAIEGILPVHRAQIVSYLKLADKRLGFLINFNVALLKQGFERYLNNF